MRREEDEKKRPICKEKLRLDEDMYTKRDN